MAISTFKRYEKKFIVTAQQYARMLPVIEANMVTDKYCLDGRAYTICNIYFDTPDNSIIRHSVSKPYFKQKLRLRSYDVPTCREDTVYLELKKKTGKIVTKRRVGMTLGEAEDYIYRGVRPYKKKYLPEQVLDEIDYFMRINPEAKPAVFISYDRRAFFLKENKDIRLTFDFNITTRRDDLDLLLPIHGERLLADGVMLMELKIPDAVPLWLAHLLSSEGVYMTSFSKYGREYKKHVLHDALLAREDNA